MSTVVSVLGLWLLGSLLVGLVVAWVFRRAGIADDERIAVARPVRPAGAAGRSPEAARANARRRPVAFPQAGDGETPNRAAAG